MLSLQKKWVTYLEKQAVMFQGTASVKFIELYGLMYVLSPEGENMKVLRLKTYFSTYTAALNHCASTRLSSVASPATKQHLSCRILQHIVPRARVMQEKRAQVGLQDLRRKQNQKRRRRRRRMRKRRKKKRMRSK